MSRAEIRAEARSRIAARFSEHVEDVDTFAQVLAASLDDIYLSRYGEPYAGPGLCIKKCKVDFITSREMDSEPWIVLGIEFFASDKAPQRTTIDMCHKSVSKACGLNALSVTRLGYAKYRVPGSAIPLFAAMMRLKGEI